MKRVTGIGGVFFKAKDPEKLYQWYEKHLGIKREPHGQGANLLWKDAVSEGGPEGSTVWAIFPDSTKYFNPSTANFMVNYRVDNMAALLAVLREEGIKIEGEQNESYGRFAWIMDPEGNRIELYEPL